MLGIYYNEFSWFTSMAGKVVIVVASIM